MLGGAWRLLVLLLVIDFANYAVDARSSGNQQGGVKKSTAGLAKRKASAASSLQARTSKSPQRSVRSQPVAPRSLIQSLDDYVRIRQPEEKAEGGEGEEAPAEGEAAAPEGGEGGVPEGEGGSEGGEEGEGEGGEGEEGGEEEEEAETEDKFLGIGVASTLIIGISFIMLIQYLVNSHDSDIRRYVWEVICCTVSIFCAVLLFQGFNALLMTACEGYSKGALLYVAQLHMLFWCIVLHYLLCFHPGKKGMAVLLAHMTGFAAISAWGGVQQYEWFKSNSLHALAVVPLSLFGTSVMIRVTDLGIETYSAVMKAPLPRHGHENAAEAAEEAENDIISFCLSFQTCQAVRLFVTGAMPNSEGEEGEAVFSHGVKEIIALTAFGVLFLGLTIATFFEEDLLFSKPSKAGEPPRQSLASAALPGIKVSGDEKARDAPAETSAEEGEEGEGEEEEEEEGEGEEGEEEEENPLSLHRIMDCAICYLTMTFAFCMFFAGQWMCAKLMITFLPTKDETILGLGLAMVMSMFSFAGIFVLDGIDDVMTKGKGQANPRLHRIIGKVVSALAVLVGFSWERCFDGAIVVLSNTTASPAVSKMVLAILCAALLVPAWRMHMLPMVIHEGWKFGFVIHGHWDVKKIAQCKNFLIKVHADKVDEMNNKDADAEESD
eukprot:TRINITY_DN82430_c0_g1_i1.p1 TRINITY_DN82430_c0_g1~~TRINITY_DN82430_c0_g1_i1.p1  ORF type:complete len:662 (+),score=196.44 TRINITY_DN82430_c0_g1_i1:128-2113(+)